MSRGRNTNHIRTKLRLKADQVMLWRADRQLSQEEAAELIGMSPVTYRRCEGGEFIQLLTAARVADHMKVPLEKLVTK